MENQINPKNRVTPQILSLNPGYDFLNSLSQFPLLLNTSLHQLVDLADLFPTYASQISPHLPCAHLP